MSGAADRYLADQAGRLVSAFPEPWEAFRDASMFITGGTGFIGRWLLESLISANDRYNLRLKALVLTRDPDAFAAVCPGLAAHPALAFTQGDARSFDFPDGRFSHVLHAAAVAANATFNNADPLMQFDIAYHGTRRALEFAAHCGARRFLMTSSGSVYGALSHGMAQIPEDYIGAPPPNALVCAPEHGKRAAEFLCEYYRHKYGIETIVARCFSFVGPGLPLDIHYAIGNFIRDAIQGDAIVVKGDGSPVRSYMYVGDLVVWLFSMLGAAPSGSLFNLGSDVAVSILELAVLVRDTLCPHKPVEVLGRRVGGASRNIYVPDISLARAVLNLEIWTPLDEAIRMTAQHAQRLTAGQGADPITTPPKSTG